MSLLGKISLQRLYDYNRNRCQETGRVSKMYSALKNTMPGLYIVISYTIWNHKLYFHNFYFASIYFMEALKNAKVTS